MSPGSSIFDNRDTGADMQPVRGLFHNEDSTHIFSSQQFPAGKAGEVIDRYVDVMADAGVTVFLCNTNSQRTNYRGSAWDAYWDGYDPDGPDDQPFLAPIPQDDVKNYRNTIANMLSVHQQGIDYPARVVQRCRHKNISPWISLRMNDCHYNGIPAHPFHSNFWRKNPKLYRKGCPGYFETCFDYAHTEVRDFYRSLIVEMLDRYDIDGLELDFMREAYLFSAGKEAEGTPILTAWMCEIRKLADAAAVRRGHPIRLGVRVPSRPEIALAMGFDAISWAREGVIDLLVVTPRWATLEFDMPLAQWRHLMGKTKTILAGGLEINYQPCPDASPSLVSPELATGAAVSFLSGGADVVYLFNYFHEGHPHWNPETYQNTLRAMTSLDSLLKLPRCVGITYRDITAPKENYRPPLPATGKEIVFSMNLGPIPDDHRDCKLSIGLVSSQETSSSVPSVFVNGRLCAIHIDTMKEGLRLFVFSVPGAALAGTSVHEIKVASKDQNTLEIRQLEMSLEKSGG